MDVEKKYEKVFCSLPFTYVYVDSLNEYKLCSDTNVSSKIKSHDQSILTYFNSEYLNNIRKKMIDFNIDDEVKKTCLKCIERESLGIWSRRDPKIKKIVLDNFKEGNINIPTSKTLKLKFGNVCNLMCLSCGPYSSSRWLMSERNSNKVKNELYYKFRDMVNNATLEKYKGYFKVSEYETKDIHAFNFNQKFYDELKILLTDIEEIVISGGEPFLSDNFYYFIEWLIKNSYSKHLNLHVFTNGMKMPKNFKRYCDKFKSFNVRISIDGIGKKDEYIRTGTNFEIKEKNINKLHDYFKVDFFTTVSMLNAGYLSEIYNFQKKFRNTHVYLNYLVEPFFLQVVNIPNEIKKIYNDKGEKNKLFNVEGEQKYFKLGILYLKKFDQINKTNLMDEWPEFYEYYSSA